MFDIYSIHMYGKPQVDGELIEVKIVHDIWNNNIHAPRNIKKCTLARSQPGDLKFNIFVDK